MITLPPNEQNSSLASTYSILIALSRPSNSQNFSETPVTSSSIKATKNVLLNIFHVPPKHMVFIVSSRVRIYLF